MAGQATTDELEESMALVWPYYFARPEAAPAMPDLRLSVPLYAAVVASVHEHLARGTLAAALPKLVMPFLVVHGAADPLPVAASRATVDLVPDAALEVISDCGHGPWLEQPARLREIVARFLYERG